MSDVSRSGTNVNFFVSSIIVMMLLAGIGVGTYFTVRAIVGTKSSPQITPTLSQSTGTITPNASTPSPVPANSGNTGNAVVTSLPYSFGYNPVNQGSYYQYINWDYPGYDLIPAKSAENYNMTIDKCKQRCDSQPNCVAFGWDPNQNNYCTSKVQANYPLTKWSGNLYIKTPRAVALEQQFANPANPPPQTASQQADASTPQ